MVSMETHVYAKPSMVTADTPQVNMLLILETCNWVPHLNRELISVCQPLVWRYSCGQCLWFMCTAGYIHLIMHLHSQNPHIWYTLWAKLLSGFGTDAGKVGLAVSLTLSRWHCHNNDNAILHMHSWIYLSVAGIRAAYPLQCNIADARL